MAYSHSALVRPDPAVTPRSVHRALAPIYAPYEARTGYGFRVREAKDGTVRVDSLGTRPDSGRGGWLVGDSRSGVVQARSIERYLRRMRPDWVVRRTGRAVSVAPVSAS